MSNQNAITTTHHDIAITYNEPSDKWLFTLRGRDKSADSLANAKAAIDKPAPKESTFVKFKAWYCQGYTDYTFRNVTVTGDAGFQYGRNEVWIKNADGSRQKVAIHYIYADTPENISAIEQLKTQNAIVKEADKIRSSVKEKMGLIALAPEVE